ncbi:MAG: BatD family protein, partial [Longimicrobiales bacterium]
MRSAHIRPRAIAGALSVIALASTEPLFAQNDIKVEANLSATRIGVGESTILQISIETRGDGADLMDLPQLPPGLEITGSQRFSQLQVAIPSGNSRLIREDLIIRAHVPGEYTIPSFTVRAGGKIYRTKPLVLYVEQGGRARTRSGPPARDEVLLRAWLEPDTVYVGEQVLLNAEALFPRDLRQRQSRPATYEAPTPTDFWIQDLPDAVASGIRSMNGDVYETQTFRRAYFPLAAGSFVMPPARILYEIRRGFLYAPEGRELVSDSLRVVVRPIPEEGQPSSFTGAVGRFTIAARLEPELVGVGEAAT